MHTRQDIYPYSWSPSYNGFSTTSPTFTVTYSTGTSGNFGYYPYTAKTVEPKKENEISQDEFDEIF